MDSNVLIGCSGWNYNETPDKGGWLNVFYPDKKTKKLRYYSQFFNTVEMDSTFYKEFYLSMTKGLFIGLTRATPDNFKFSIKVPEIITHEKRLDVDKNVISDFLEFLNKISPLKSTNKLGTIIIQLPPSFTINEFAKTERFLNKLTSVDDENIKNNNYSMEFRHPSWNTEGTFEMLQHYNIATVKTDSPSKENLGFLSDENNVVTNTHSILRMHGRNDNRNHYWYDYLYSESELIPWADKIKKIKERVENSVFIYFNNHYGGKAIVNALQFKELLNKNSLTENEILVLEKAKKFFSNDN